MRNIFNWKCKNNCIMRKESAKLADDSSVHRCACFWPECKSMGLCHPGAVTMVDGVILWTPDDCGNYYDLENGKTIIGDQIVAELEKRGLKRRVIVCRGRRVWLHLTPEEYKLSDEKLCSKLTNESANWMKRYWRRGMTVLCVTIIIAALIYLLFGF